MNSNLDSKITPASELTTDTVRVLLKKRFPGYAAAFSRQYTSYHQESATLTLGVCPTFIRGDVDRWCARRGVTVIHEIPKDVASQLEQAGD